MAKICYKPIDFSAATQETIDRANQIIAGYVAQGFDLTLRQLYYQFVARSLLENNIQNYKRLGSIVNDARLAGQIDWNNIEDRTRGAKSVTVWDEPGSIIAACAAQFKIDKWASQPYYCEVWIEKEALAGVFERVCQEFRVSYLSCRGYTSQSEMWRASQRLAGKRRQGKQLLVLHFGDHDPSGIDMSRDIVDRLELFMGGVEFQRLALNMDQVRKYNPPPNPAKTTDSRAATYILAHGAESWELDALEPTLLDGIVRRTLDGIIDGDAWEAATEEEDEHRRLLREASSQWEELTRSL